MGLISVLLGIWAYSTCCAETELEWKKNHAPTEKVWKTGLQSEGYQLLQNPQALAQVFKNLPTRVEAGNRIWESHDSQNMIWWAIYPGLQSAGNSSDPLIFCLDCQHPPKKWEPAGEGWDGYEAVLNTAEQQVKAFGNNAGHGGKLAQIAKTSKRPEIFDPREIRY